MSQSIKPRYRTINWKQYNAALKARGSLTVWLNKRMNSYYLPKYIYGLSSKCYEQMIRRY